MLKDNNFCFRDRCVLLVGLFVSTGVYSWLKFRVFGVFCGSHFGYGVAALGISRLIMNCEPDGFFGLRGGLNAMVLMGGNEEMVAGSKFNLLDP